MTDEGDPGLLKKHSTSLSYTTEVAIYPSIRTFFYPHPHIDKFPSEPTTLPLLVFVHGLGGSLAQFHPLLTTLTNIASCFGIDFPGCGLSSFAPKTWSAYSVESLALLLAAAIEKHRDASKGQKVILIGHSLGTAICNLLSSSTSPVATGLGEHIVGFIAVCPVAEPPSRSQVADMRRLLHIPGPIFDLWRRWDRRGGPNSPSVSRFVGENADGATRMLQLRFNERSRTPVWRRMAWGSLPTYNGDGETVGGIPGLGSWGAIVDTPVLLVAGESDPITKAANVDTLLQFVGIKSDIASWSHVGDATPGFAVNNNKRTVKAFTFPAPASHALLYGTSTYRALSGLIQDFLAKYVDERLSLGWQLQYLTTSGKWDVKNLAKWQVVNPVSESIGGIFVAMKTLREVDAQHSPLAFATAWRNKIYAVIDISHERPVYDPAQLEKGGIHYHKLPTVSKIPPTKNEVRDFISLVDRLRNEISQETVSNEASYTPPLLGVHCHYGFNRTGFFIASYLTQRLGFTVQGALDEFEKRRPPGIRHEHFIDTLFVRYCVGGG